MTLTSGAIEPVRIDPAQVPGLQAPEPQAIEPASRLQCRVINDSKNFRVRLADLDIEWTNEEPDAAPMTRGYLKTLSLEPGSATDILAWFPAEVREARCRLRGVRGQPAGWLP